MSDEAKRRTNHLRLLCTAATHGDHAREQQIAGHDFLSVGRVLALRGHSERDAVKEGADYMMMTLDGDKADGSLDSQLLLELEACKISDADV